MLKVAFVGWRGLVGSVLMRSLIKEDGFHDIDPYFFSTTTTGPNAPKHPLQKDGVIKNSYDLDELSQVDIIVSCQGSDYTKKVYENLRKKSWTGYWLDAASHLRREEKSTLLLDPVNHRQITEALQAGKKDFIGANCTVSLMLLAIHGLIKENLVEWIHSATYQAVSGSGSAAIKNLLDDMKQMGKTSEQDEQKIHILDQMGLIHNQFKKSYPGEKNLASNVLPWIDKEESPGKTLEEAKGFYETNKILGLKEPIPLDGTCVRVPVLRSHSQVLTLKLKKDLKREDFEKIIAQDNKWVKVIPNQRESSLTSLNPLTTSSTFDILVGRARKLNLPGNFFEVFTVGDQLLWGASEPIRRGLKLIVDFLSKKGL